MGYDRDTLVVAYLRHIAEHTPADFWASEAVGEIARGPSPEDAWDLVVTLVRRAPDGLLGRIGAGPLEDLVNEHGPELVEWIEGECQRDRRFKAALARMWLTSGALPAGVEARIMAASDGRIQLLSGNPMPAVESRRDT